MILNSRPTHPRHELDFYATPRSFADAGLALIQGEPATILDAGAGEGVWGEAARDRWPPAHLTAVDIAGRGLGRPYDHVHQGDYLGFEGWGTYDLIVSNPPYCHAESFIRHSLKLLRFGGSALFFLRLAFLEGQGRTTGLWREYPPALVSVCSGRPRFYGTGSGATAFAFVLWRQGHQGPTQLGWSRT